jgi:predicted  nucleic acid-binding Zn-ribbon protein
MTTEQQKRLIGFLLCLALAFSLTNILPVTIGTAAPAPTINATDKEKLFALEADILALLKERHNLAGEAIDLRVKILDVKKRAVQENVAAIRQELNSLSIALKEKNTAIEDKNKLIKQKTDELKALLPGKTTKKATVSTNKKVRAKH